MSKRGKEENAVTVAGEVVPMVVSLKPVQFEQPEAESVDLAGLPAEWAGAEKLGGFAPSPKFETPGESLFGTYVTVRGGVGPNKTRVYEIMAYMGPDKKQELTAVWGSTALDRMFDSAYPPVKAGDRIGITYIGEKETARKQNPVKLFQLRILRPGQGGAETMASGKADASVKKTAVDITPPKQ